MEISNEKKLGRGLSALLGNMDNNSGNKFVAKSGETIQQILLSHIIPGIYQPRKHFDHNQLLELSSSIRENGIIQPIIVRRTDAKDTFEIIAGERRFRAAKIVGLDKISAIIKNIDNSQALEFAIIENVQRENLSLIEEARGYKQLMNEFEYSQDKIAKKIGCSRSHIANILRLLFLPIDVQDLLDQSKITFGHAKAIMNRENPSEIAKQIVENGWTVRDLEVIFSNEKSRDPAKYQNSKNTSSPKSKEQRNTKVTNIEQKLSMLLPNTMVRSEYRQQKQRGKITIFFKDLSQIAELIDNL
jgi:ParB family chromosome partitioning protein